MSTNPGPVPTKRPIHHHALAMVAAPLAHWHHRRYAGRTHHLVIDTTWNIVMWAAAAWLVSLLITTIVTDVPHLAWSGPALVSGQPSELTLTLKSFVPGKFHDVTVRPQWPTTWSVSAPTSFTIPELDQTIPRTAVFQVTPHDSPDTVRTIMTTVTWTSAGRTYTTQVVQQWRVIGTVLELSVTAPATVSPDEQFSMGIHVNSKGSLAQTGVAVEPIIPAGVSIVSSSPKLEHLVWGLDQLVPGASRTLTLTLRMDRTSGTARLGAKVGFVTADAYQEQMVRTTDVTVRVSTPESIVTAAPLTAPTLATAVRYRSAAGTQFGFGPIPPRVGSPTSYRIFWYVGAGHATAQNAVASMKLPPGATWNGHASLSGGQHITYDPIRRLIVWTIGSVPAGSGPMTASFDVSVIPGRGNVGKAMAVTGLTTLTYRSASNASLTVTAPSLSTSSAEGASGSKGIVQK